jgi:hypothetical protein
LHRNYLLKCVTEGKIEGRIEVTGRQKIHKQLLGDLKEKWVLDVERGSTTSHSVEEVMGLL